MVLKRLKTAAVFTFLIFILAGCSGVLTDTSNRILRPGNNSVPLKGTWKITEYCTGGLYSKTVHEPENNWVGVTVGFTEDSMAFGEEYWDNVNYKIKLVGAEEYFLHKFPGAVSRFGISGSQVTVVTASSDQKFLYEFIKVSEKIIIADIDDEYYKLEKISDSYSRSMPKQGPAQFGTYKALDSGAQVSPRSGLLLGLRIPEASGLDKEMPDYGYQTYWISSIDGVISPVLAAEDVFLPRKDGFWRLQLVKDPQNAAAGDFLYASTVSLESKKLSPPGQGSQGYFIRNNSLSLLNGMPQAYSKTRRTILYVGNDYVCVENSAFSRDKKGAYNLAYKALRTLPVDNVSNAAGIKISDLTGGNGATVMESAISNLFDSQSSYSFRKVGDDRQEENFALFRKTGHWFFKGRINVIDNSTADKEADQKVTYLDFNINLIPPLNMVAYDVLQVPWTAIKDRVPQAVDAYTSPEKDLAVILTRTEILLYRLDGGSLSEKPAEKLKITEGTAVFMAEWATGDYVENWEKAFIKNNTVKTIEAVQ